MKAIGRFLPYIAGLALILLLFSQINPAEVLEQLRNATPAWLLIGCGWYLLTNTMRAFRFGVLLKMSSLKNIIRLLPEMFALSFLNNVLPSRTGEFTFPYLLLKRHDVPVAESATALLLARIFDYLAVIILFICFGLFELNNLEANAARIIGSVILLSILSIVLLMAAPWVSSLLLALFQKLLSFTRMADSNLGQRLLHFGTAVVDALRQMRSLSIYMRTFGWSLGIWLCTFAWFGAFLNAIGMPIRYTLIVVGATFASLAKAVPFITIGGFGAHELGWSLGFSLTGMERSAAITSGFTVNILTLTMSILFGGAALLWMSMVGHEKE